MAVSADQAAMMLEWFKVTELQENHIAEIERRILNALKMSHATIDGKQKEVDEAVKTVSAQSEALRLQMEEFSKTLEVQKMQRDEMGEKLDKTFAEKTEAMSSIKYQRCMVDRITAHHADIDTTTGCPIYSHELESSPALRWHICD